MNLAFFSFLGVKRLMLLAEEERKGEVAPGMNGNHPDKRRESPEKEEPSIALLQWYLKMVIDIEPEKKDK
jgi:hypothetical protein